MLKHKRLLSILAFALLLIGIVLAVGAAGALPMSLADTPGPLPNDCQGVTEEGEPPPVCCAFGYVYYDGVPVDGVQVTIQGPAGSFNTTTSTGPAATDAYYRVSLSASPLSVSPGDTITVTATYSDSTASTVYQVVASGQQVDVVIPTADGSQPPIGTINYIHPNPARQGSDTVAFAGSGVDGDEDGASIAAWEWVSNLDGVLSTQEDFQLAASSLSAGTHSISFRVQDDEGNWSGAVVRTLEVETADTPTPTPTPTPCGPTNVSGIIASDTTWDRTCGPYIVTGNVFVNSGVRLTIAPGVTVKFDSQKVLTVQGTLVASGTAASLITFTSNSASPAKGDWNYIHFTDSSVDATFDGSGNYVSGSVIQYAIIEYAGSESGMGALHIEASSPYIDHNTIRNNRQGGIYAYNSVGLRITNNSVTGNGLASTAGREGAIFVYRSDTTIIRGNTVSDNIHTGIQIYDGTTTISDNTITGNTANMYTDGIGSGGISANWGTHTISNNIVTGNTGYDYGGGIGFYGNGVISNNIIANNTVSRSGGGIYNEGATISNNIIANNTTSEVGGGIWTRSGTVSNNTITGNTAHSRGGGIIFFGGDLISGNTITNNSTFAAH